MRRRAVVATVGTFAVAGCLGEVVGEVSDATGGVGGSPPTDTRVVDVRPHPSFRETAILKRVELFESGAARLTMAEDLGCYDRVALVHERRAATAANLEAAEDVWTAPEFGGELVVDARGSLDPSVEYPSRAFEFTMIREDDLLFCTARGTTTIGIEVPPSWVDG